MLTDTNRHLYNQISHSFYFSIFPVIIYFLLLSLSFVFQFEMKWKKENREERQEKNSNKKE